MGERGAIEAESLSRVLGVLSGNDMPTSQVEAWARSANQIYAADGGANVLSSLGITPDYAVGDMDSITPQAREAAKELLVDSSQDRSDCDKLLALVAKNGARSITLCNVEGDYPDHFLGTLHSCVRSSLEVKIAFRRGIGHVLRGDGSWNFKLPLGARLSLLPLDRCEGVSLTGAAWELHDEVLQASGLTSLSNRVTGLVTVKMRSGAALLVALHPSLETPAW